MKTFRLLSASLLLGALTGCASLTPPQASVPQTGADIPAGWLLDLPSDAGANLGWAALYDDPLMLDYLRQAETENFDIRTAQTRIAGAEADLRRAAAQLKPRFDASASATGSALLSEIDDPFDSYGLGISGRWDPDIFGQTQTIIDGSRANLRVQEALAEDTRQAVLAATAVKHLLFRINMFELQRACGA